MINKHGERLIFAFVFGACFALIGYFLPAIYKEHLDKTDYIEIRQPAPLEKEVYNKGEQLTLIINRRTFVETQVDFHAEIVRINGDEHSLTLSDKYAATDGIIDDTEGEYKVTVSRNFRVPCEALEGRNFLRVALEYDVEGVEKKYSYITQVFEVTREIDPFCQQ